jgi:GR25 family glycosyltransferase involved in LPS biosynthesis
MEPFTLLKNILYINLDHRTDRLQQVNDEFTKKLNIEGLTNRVPERFSAIRHPNGAIGCALSHIKCLEIALQRKYPYVFICEDDIEFLVPEHFLKAIREFEANPPKRWNVFIVSGNTVPPYAQYNSSCIKVVNCQTTTGYITHYNYYEALIQNYKEGVSQLIRNIGSEKYFAIDKYWKELQLSRTWYMLYPPCVIQRESYSDIEKRVVNYASLMLDLEKKHLFKEVPKMNFM